MGIVNIIQDVCQSEQSQNLKIIEHLDVSCSLALMKASLANMKMLIPAENKLNEK